MLHPLEREDGAVLGQIGTAPGTVSMRVPGWGDPIRLGRDDAGAWEWPLLDLFEPELVGVVAGNDGLLYTHETIAAGCAERTPRNGSASEGLASRRTSLAVSRDG